MQLIEDNATNSPGPEAEPDVVNEAKVGTRYWDGGEYFAVFLASFLLFLMIGSLFIWWVAAFGCLQLGHFVLVR